MVRAKQRVEAAALGGLGERAPLLPGHSLLALDHQTDAHHPGSYNSRVTEERDRLRDGSTILIRPIEPDDKAALEEGLEHMSVDSRYKRFFAPVPRLTQQQLRYFTEVDHHDHEAL